jgi:hypothetical protein
MQKLTLDPALAARGGGGGSGESSGGEDENAPFIVEGHGPEF